MGTSWKIGFAGTDGRTLLSALTVSTSKGSDDPDVYRGIVIRGTPAMPGFARDIMDWDVGFVKTEDNSVEEYVRAIEAAFAAGELDYVIPMPESLLLNGIVDRMEEKGLGERVAGLNRAGSYIEGDKIRCKEFCERAGIPVAHAWSVADARSFSQVSRIVLNYLHAHGGAVLKFPYSAGGKGARIILDAWEIRQVYDELVRDYKKAYKRMFKNREWPVLIESRMSGVEISFTLLVDGQGGFCILPTAMDYPERFQGPASSANPITGGMGSISPHPFESESLMELVRESIALPLVRALKQEGLLRPCILYPGCFVSMERTAQGILPRAIRVCEINIRPGEPEFQAVIRRIKNPGQLFSAMFREELDRVEPEIREDQICMTTALVTGPGGPDGQKGYPWRVTRNEKLEMDFSYLKKKRLLLIPSAMGVSHEKGFISDGTRVAYLVLNGSVGKGGSRAETAQKMMNRVKTAFGGGRIRVIPREDPDGNRLAMRADIGSHFLSARDIFSE
ncbi:hypothetical protein [Desulfospira joergensenii]|uniref:hypothetical protein n=1 Tax=Desulfospira joergensenii TaxID=53329 RepID=UPI0003B72A08|nr:hypothetical protein [Desulfospira joergensenii]